MNRNWSSVAFFSLAGQLEPRRITGVDLEDSRFWR
jgi:hypothetical protein